MLVTAQLSVMATDSEGAVGLIAQNEAADEFKRWTKRERDTARETPLPPDTLSTLVTCAADSTRLLSWYYLNHEDGESLKKQNNGELIRRCARQIRLLVSGSALSQKEMKKEKTQFHWGERLIRPAASHSPLMKLSHLLCSSQEESRAQTSCFIEASADRRAGKRQRLH